MKVWHSLENLHARYAEGIHQEVAAIMTCMLLTSEMEAQARGSHKLAQRPYESRRLQSLSIGLIANKIPNQLPLFSQPASKTEAVRKEVEYCLKQYWRYKQKNEW